jgi:hypothetical protein
MSMLNLESRYINATFHILYITCIIHTLISLKDKVYQFIKFYSGLMDHDPLIPRYQYDYAIFTCDTCLELMARIFPAFLTTADTSLPISSRILFFRVANIA